jgi:predicted alpha-1,6-mannanase (GH76 family)
MTNYAGHAQAGIQVLLNTWQSDLLDMYGSRWWNKAIALEMVADYMIATKSTEYSSFIDAMYQSFAPFIQWADPKWNDDVAWWGLAWVRAYEWSVQAGQANSDYWNMATKLFSRVAESWDGTCNGGVWFQRPPFSYSAGNFKGSIENEQFLALACRLHLSDPSGDSNGSYRNWAVKTCDWFLKSGMINAQSLINNGLDAQCRNDQGEIWTYTQGVILGGLADLARIESQPDLLDQAGAIASATIATLRYPDGVLREPCEVSNNCNDDQVQFKGIFMRYLGVLQAEMTDPARKASYQSFIQHNADSIWSVYGSAQPQFGLTWNAKWSQPASFMTQVSALEALIAAIPL